jgi:hypothetical protein
MRSSLLQRAVGAAVSLPAFFWLCSVQLVFAVPPIEVFSAGPAAAGKPEIFYKGQAADNGKIVLNASNGFFDHGTFVAGGAGAGDPADHGLIETSFDYLKCGAERGAARWYLWIEKPGGVKVRFFIGVPAAEANSNWRVQVGNQVQELKLEPADEKNAQAATLRFKIDQPGKVLVSLQCADAALPKEIRINEIELTGPAIDGAKLLRARWRPAAVHCAFIAPPECKDPTMWVFETRCLTPVSSYSPITTPFGYFGTEFRNGKIPAGSSYNFSMWAAGRNATEAPPPEEMPRLIATGHPEAAFGSFGGEGTGLKMRDAVAYEKQADRAIQGFRISSENNLHTYFGYVFDESKDHWVLFAAGQKPGTKARDSKEYLNRTGSFCEIPGPPDVERTGDVQRIIERRGWFYGSDGKWYPAELAGTEIGGRKAVRAERAHAANGQPPVVENQYNRYADDSASDGWMISSAGGMEHYEAGTTSSAPTTQAVPALPPYLSGDKAKELFDLPVIFGSTRATAITSTSATINYVLTKAGTNATAKLYYGTQDCITFDHRDNPGKAGVQKDIFSAARTWQNTTLQQPVKTGDNPIILTNLQPHTTYYYRLYVTNAEGKSWDYQSGVFTTSGD